MFTQPRLCAEQPTEYFASATTKQQIAAGKKMCRQCPALTECWEWVKKIHYHHNITQNNRDDPWRDIIIQGVVAAQHWTATDGRGRPLDVPKLDRSAQKLVIRRAQK